MRTCVWVAALMLAGCATAEAKTSTGDAQRAPELAETEAAGTLKARLDAMPACAANVETGVLELRPTICTKRACRSACCNACGWKATLQTRSGATVAVDEAKVRSGLKLKEGSAMECEVDAWTHALAGVSLSLEGDGCVAR